MLFVKDRGRAVISRSSAAIRAAFWGLAIVFPFSGCAPNADSGVDLSAPVFPPGPADPSVMPDLKPLESENADGQITGAVSTPASVPAAQGDVDVAEEETTSAPDRAPAPPAQPSGGPAEDAGPPVVEPHPLPATGLGLCPRSYDAPGFEEVFDLAAEAADVGVVQLPFAWDRLNGRPDYPSYDSYAWLVEPQAPDGRNMFQKHGLQMGLWISFLDPGDPSRLRVNEGPAGASFRDPAVSAAFVEECVWLAKRFEPAYLALGTEIDSYLQIAPTDEREALLASIQAARARIKAVRPDVTLFVYFQLEHVRAAHLWEAIRPFAEASDAAAFSSYPSLAIDAADSGFRAAELPADYYRRIAGELAVDRPLILAELGHPSQPSEVFSAGSDAEQAEFLRKVFAVLPANTRLVTWTYLYDPDLSSVYAPPIAAYFGSMGLRRSDGGVTTGWTAWRSAVGR